MNNNKILIVIIMCTVISIGASLYLHYTHRTASSVNNSTEEDDLLDKDCVIAILAPWCGHCKNLKKSGLLDQLSKYIEVKEIDDTHRNTRDIMAAVGSEGFPTIVLYRDGKLTGFRGDRNISSLVEFINN
jgi:protein disulfide-isomerase A1